MSDFGPKVTLNNPAFIHPSALLYGKVTVEEEASIWPYVVARAENYEIKIGKRTNIQDFVMLHVGYDTPTIIGENCSITHHCTIHGCSIGNNTLVGINSTIMDGCIIGDNCIIGAHTFLKDGTVIPDNSVVMGSPGEVKKERNSYVANCMNAELYLRNAHFYAEGKHNAWEGPEFAAELMGKMSDLGAEFKKLYG
ncbi:MAG: gamma carbonic anhydrase family protein [Rhodospirillales bacterium]|nr:gamma carbonic anhydrase family protein [Rhodospirillales bacterium]